MLSKEDKLRRILGALPGIYDVEAGATVPSCERFCRNVCQSLFPFQQTQCINDCLACQQTGARPPARPPRRKR
ncbi:hypothetical protein [Alkalihalobacterium chitinilyticum]|uniref:Uncharacterized protein n=1 Tax=Alkalihalobacterium chitinilyticum TaxID=2980103 RepID=A0ABT5VDN5_9BACI|nr:hypothetical protein [Alkalihalobacterium chitinilyticum]MDE5413569.1 hypothetical protein [Alkalihalobacterium chitinilyticum]